MNFKEKILSLFILLSILNTTLLVASNYDEDNLKIFSKILPRFILMSSQKNKIKENIEICILNEEIDQRIAFSLMDKIKTNYPNGLKNHKINLINANYSSFRNCQKSQLMFIFNSNKQNIDKALIFSKKHQILTMSYDFSLLEDGVSISLFIGRKVVPYINMKSIKENKIKLNNILLRVSKIYTGNEK